MSPSITTSCSSRPRALGEQTIGTQGTPVQALGKLIAQRQLPKLWDTRSRLVELFDAERTSGT